MTILCRGTNVGDNFPRCFGQFMISDLGMMDISLWALKGFSSGGYALHMC